MLTSAERAIIKRLVSDWHGAPPHVFHAEGVKP
jgi:hypothetical protein